MKKAFKLISAAALLAATATAASAQNVPLNTTVAGGQGNEQLQGQGGGEVALTTALGVAGGLTALAFLAASASDTSSAGTP